MKFVMNELCPHSGEGKSDKLWQSLDVDDADAAAKLGIDEDKDSKAENDSNV